MNDPSNPSPKASKDCRICNRRRIKCDRSTPSCKKCNSRNLTCPGYGVKLNWEWGVASRGKLARKSIPLLGPTLIDISSQVNGQSSAQNSIQDNRNEHLAASAETPTDSLIVSTRDNKALRVVVDIQPNPRTYLGTKSLIPPTPVLLQDSASRHLFHHYEEVIASTMVWVDSDCNPWRSVMIPMALQSNSLLMSILALSAEHLSAISPQTGEAVHNLTNRSVTYRDRALRLLALDMQSDAIVGETSIPKTTRTRRNELANSLLASMLVLCNMETVRPESKLWRVHLDAARTIVKLRSSVSATEDVTFKFLLEQFFVTDAFACTTSFAQIDHEEVVTEDAGSVFIEFLSLIRRVTAIERQDAARGWSDPEAEISPSALLDLFEQARDRTLLLSAKTHFGSEAERSQFLSVVESFHHAGLLYSYRCLSYLDQETEICKVRLELFEDLDLLPSDHSGFAQDVMWPLFIAGTEATRDDGTRVLVERKLEQAMKRTGFSNCQEALAFLKALWIARDGELGPLGVTQNGNENRGATSELNWIHCARAWANMGNHFFVF